MMKFFKTENNPLFREEAMAVISTAIFFISVIFGEGIGGSFAANDVCYKYLGCTSGFFGFDAIEHLIFGVAATWVLVLIFQKFPKYSLFSDKLWKNILIIISLIALMAVLWEIFECCWDAFRTNILHDVLVNWKLHINMLNQPNNLDTMGDMTFGLVGSIVALFFIKIKKLS